MTPQQLLWLAGALVSMNLALVGVVFTLIVKRVDRLERRQENIGERLTTTETLTTANKEKIKDVDDRRHRYQVEQRHEVTDLQKWITEKIIDRLTP